MSTILSPSVVSSVVRRQHVSAKSVALRNQYVRRVVLFLALAASLSLSFVWTRVRVIQLGYEVTRLHRDMVALEHERAKIEEEIAKLKSPDRLERIAKSHFGMRLPIGSEIVFVK